MPPDPSIEPMPKPKWIDQGTPALMSRDLALALEQVQEYREKLEEAQAEVARLKERVAWEMQRSKALEDALAKGGGE